MLAEECGRVFTRGGSEFEVGHAEAAKRQIRGELARVTKVNGEMHDVTLVWRRLIPMKSTSRNPMQQSVS